MTWESALYIPILYPQIVGCVLLSSLLGLKPLQVLLSSLKGLKPLQDLRDPTGLPGVHAEFRRHGSGKGVDCFSFFVFFFWWGVFQMAPFPASAASVFQMGCFWDCRIFAQCAESPPIVTTLAANQHFKIPSMFAFDLIISICIILPVHPSMPRKQRICCLHRGEP